MADRYRFSIVVPVYQVETYLEKCVRSLLNQTGMQNQIEILLVDDGSRDKSGVMCDAFAEGNSCVKALHKENGGLSSARNYGIDRALGDYILFVDSDDYIESDTCQRLEKILEIHGDVDVISFNGIEETENEASELRRCPVEKMGIMNGQDYLRERYQQRNLNVQSWLYGYRRGFLNTKKLRFKEGILHEDVEFTPRLLLQAQQVLEIPDIFYHYVIRENSISTKKNKEKNIKDLYDTLKKQCELAEELEPELCKWMKNAALDSWLNMIQEARMYRPEYRRYINKRFLIGKAYTPWNRFRVVLCFVSVRMYCFMNDFYKKKIH